MLATSSFLASAAGSSFLISRILPSSMASTTCPYRVKALAMWPQGHSVDPPSSVDAFKQKNWDSVHAC